MDKKLKIGVLGAGHLGKIHLRLLSESDRFDLVGFYDEQPQIAAKISREFGYRSFSEWAVEEKGCALDVDTSEF